MSVIRSVTPVFSIFGYRSTLSNVSFNVEKMLDPCLLLKELDYFLKKLVFGRCL